MAATKEAKAGTNVLAIIESLADAESLTAIIDAATAKRASLLTSAINEARERLNSLLSMAGEKPSKAAASGERAPRGSAVKARETFPPSLSKALEKVKAPFTAAQVAKAMGAPNVALAGYVAGGLLKIVGEAEKAEGQRGKPSALYELTAKGEKALKAA